MVVYRLLLWSTKALLSTYTCRSKTLMFPAQRSSKLSEPRPITGETVR